VPPPAIKLRGGSSRGRGCDLDDWARLARYAGPDSDFDLLVVLAARAAIVGTLSEAAARPGIVVYDRP
jgi:hypothetical protein